MSRKGVMIDGGKKIRKRGCSSSSSSSSRILNYRLNKRAILVGKNRAGLGRSRSTWRMRSELSQGGKSTRPISARRLAATLWEMNEIPSPQTNSKRHHKKSGLPPQLLDPPHSPTVSVSEKMDPSGTGSLRRRAPSVSQRIMSAVDSISNASFMEIETGGVGNKVRLKDVSNALTSSKELLTIINRMWDRPSSSSTMSLISALHTELERAQLQVNQLIQEERSEMKYILKCFAEEKASWKGKVEAAIGSIAGELEVERKLRRRLESFNTKLGKELSEMKSSFISVVKELETEKRAREITQQVCDELARNIDEVEKEREMLELADKLREERVQMKLSEAKHQFEEKNSDITKLRKQLQGFLLPTNYIISHQSEIELDLNNNKGYKWGHTSAAPRRSISLQRSISDGVEWATGNQYMGEGSGEPSCRLGLPHNPESALQERSSLSRSRTANVRAESHTVRRSKYDGH